MAISSFLGLQTALRGLLAEQRSLDLTGHNIANVSTPGYTRQEAVLTTAPNLPVLAGATSSGSGALLGQGVDVSVYRRMRDTFADLQYRASSQAFGQQDAIASGLQQVDNAFSEPGPNGVSALLNKFWDGWHDFSNNPEDVAGAGQAVLGRAQSLADAIRQLDASLAGIATDAKTEYDTILGPQGDVLAAAKQIAQLNGDIERAVNQGQQPNDLMDRRDALVDELSKTAGIRVTTAASGVPGGIDITFDTPSQPLVTDTTVNWNPPTTVATAPGGRLGGLQALFDPSTGKVAAYRAALNTVVSQLIGSAGPPPTGVNGIYGGTFFSGTNASNIDLGVSTVRASTPGAPAGANDVALAIAALRGGPADQSYSTLISSVGADAHEAEQRQTGAKAVLDAANDRRTSVSGVSLDEEMANMIRFQRGYQASARTMSTLDDMLDTLINRTGRVGL
jgi:flagellar hook-associated protein 1